MNASLKEKRRFFRVYFSEALEGFIKPEIINEKKVELDKSIPISILDMSAGGMKIETTVNLPVEANIIFDIAFKLEGEEFNLQGELVWKKESHKKIKYGIYFIELTLLEEQHLIRCLNKYQVKKANFRRERLKLMKSRDLDYNVVKTITAFPYPAYLVSKDRLVLASNQEKHNDGSGIGERCHLTIFNNDEICPYCQMGEALSCDDLISKEIDLNKEKYRVYWLYIENGYFLHYVMKEE